MKSIIVLLAGAIVFTSCETDSGFEQLKLVNNALERSNDVIAETTRMTRITIDSRKNFGELQTRRVMLHKLDSLHNKTETVVKYINSLKASIGDREKDKQVVSEIFEQHNKGLELYKMLANYVEAVTISFVDDDQVDIETMVKDLNMLLEFEPDNENASKMWVKLNFQDANAASARALLSTLQNNVLMTENRLVQEYESRTGVLTHDYTTFKALAIISTTHVKAGEELEVYAGLGEFSVSSKPEITINGNKAKPDVDGVVNYKLKAEQQPGEHVVTVNFKFTGPDGLNRTVIKEMRYTVVN